MRGGLATASGVGVQGGELMRVAGGVGVACVTAPRGAVPVAGCSCFVFCWSGRGDWERGGKQVWKVVRERRSRGGGGGGGG